MTVVTIKVWDEGDELKMEATVDNTSAIDEPPTPALVFGSYLGANAQEISEAAWDWFKTGTFVKQAAPEPEIYRPLGDILT